MTLLPGRVSQTTRQHGVPSLDQASLWPRLPHRFSHSFSCLALNHDEVWEHIVAQLVSFVPSRASPARLVALDRERLSSRPAWTIASCLQDPWSTSNTWKAV